MMNQTVMQTSSFCFYTMLVLFAWTGIITTTTPRNTDILAGGLAGLRDRVNGLNQDSKKMVARAMFTSIPLNIDGQYLVKLSEITTGIEVLYSNANNNHHGFEANSEGTMGDLLQRGVNAFKSGTPADKSAFTEIVKEVCDGYHGLVKKFVNSCQSTDEHGVVLKQVSNETLDIVNESLIHLVGNDDAILNAFVDAYNEITIKLNKMIDAPEDKSIAGMVEQFKTLIEKVKPHMVFFNSLQYAICENKDVKAHEKAVDDYEAMLSKLISNLKKHITKQKVEYKNYVATAKIIVKFLDDMRMSIKIVVQNRDILAIRYAEIARVYSDTKMIADITEEAKNKTGDNKQDYDNMNGDAKSKVNLRFYISPQKSASGSASGSSGPSGKPPAGVTPPAPNAKGSKSDDKTQKNTSTTDKDDSKPWYRKTWPWVVGIGVVVLAAGFGLLAVVLFRKK
ncbi:hypothetical protein VCUG_02498 [Vavraia culicis subsp. floridensis]|uniref:Uncharacterized protein n=1 Tax=Vavraia culicis (isolate floridensis) TaxID=948595 RepID=L2GRL8_VAVCU|nr:uncharacterized protein VCUG_02498 [Vavraia culicis subsp. floridensis]ELA46022.1 hypothetical protein VCUG_02498 [Vavraia culicis subsp. floridensis]